MQLATVISDCGWANYDPGSWTEAGATVLMIEAASNPAAYLHACRILAAVSRWNSSDIIRDAVTIPARLAYREIADWFRGDHSGDWLGAIPRDIVGIVESYLHVRITRQQSVTRVTTTYFLAVEAVYRHNPSRITVGDRYRELHWCSGRMPTTYSMNYYGGEYVCRAWPETKKLNQATINMRCNEWIRMYAPW